METDNIPSKVTLNLLLFPETGKGPGPIPIMRRVMTREITGDLLICGCNGKPVDIDGISFTLKDFESSGTTDAKCVGTGTVQFENQRSEQYMLGLIQNEWVPCNPDEIRKHECRIPEEMIPSEQYRDPLFEYFERHPLAEPYREKKQDEESILVGAKSGG